MTNLVLLAAPAADATPDAATVRDRVGDGSTTVVSLHAPTIEDGALVPDEFLQPHSQYGVDLASIGDDFRLRDIVLVKTPSEASPLEFVLLHLWNWPDSTYDIDAVRVPHEGETDPRNNPLGKNPGNIWAFSESLNDRKPGTQSRLFDPGPSETVAGGHLEREAIERLLNCHTDAGDAVHVWAAADDVATIEGIAADMDRDVETLPAGESDERRPIPVMTEELPVDAPDDPESLADLAAEIDDEGVAYRICDCRAGIERLPDGSIQDVVTSPPYNIAYDPFNVPTPDPATGEVRSPLREGYEDEMPAERYHHLLQSTFAAIDAKMDPDSADAFVNIKNNYQGGDCRPPFWLLALVPDAWRFTDLLVWRYDISYDPAKRKYKPYYEWIFRFSKGTPATAPEHTSLRDYYIPIVKGNSDAREGLVHPAIYPTRLVRTCLERSDHDGLVVDPFLGSGTTVAAARELGRPAVGFEQNDAFEDDIRTRIRRAGSRRV